MIELSTIESNSPNIADSLAIKQSLFLVFDNVVKICYNLLYYLNWLTSLAWFSSSTLPNLNNRDKEK